MRRNLAGAIVLLVLLGAAPALFAQMDQLTNLSVEWMRMPARNAANDSADAAVYNPAGLAFMTEGWHIELANQSLMRKPQHSYDLWYNLTPLTREQDGIDGLLPNFYMAYKTDTWALYGGAYISGGGAVVDYPEGSVNTDLVGLGVLFSPLLDDSGNPTGLQVSDAYGVTGQYLKASSYYLTFIGGCAFSLTDALAVSVGARHIRASNHTQAGLTLGDSPLGLDDVSMGLDSKDKANGTGWVAGIHAQFSRDLTIAAHYESRVKLDFETTVDTDELGLVTNGAKNRRDLPAALYLGAGLQLDPKLKLLADFNYWYQKKANWGTTTVAGETVAWSALAGDCWAAGAGLAYQVNKQWQLSAGAVYTKFLFSNKDAYYTRLGEFEAPKGDNWNLGAGFAVSVARGVRLNLALGMTLWKNESIHLFNAAALLGVGELLTPLVTVKNRAYSAALGLNLDL
jgi:long-chain fatty acid transport protein